MSLISPKESISAAELEAVIEASADVMFKISEAGRILSCRVGRFADPFWHTEDMLGKKVENTILSSAPSISKAIRNVVEEQDVKHLEYFVQVPDMKKWYEVRMLPSDNQEVLAVFKDITSQKKAQEEKQQTEALFKAVFDNTYHLTALLSPDGNMLHVNKTALSFGGIAIEEVEGKPLWEAPWWNVPDNQPLRLRAGIRSAAANNFIRYETQVRGGDGNIYFIDFSLKAIADDHNNVIYLIAEGRDISERKKMEEELARSQKMYRTVAQNIPRGMLLVLNQDMEFTLAEGELLEYIGWEKEEVEGRTLQDLSTNPNFYELLHKHYQAGLQGVANTFEFKGDIPNVYYNVIVQPLIQQNGHIEDILVIVYDVYEQKKMALELRQNLHELEATVNTLKHKNEQLEQFAYISSHDLQEPLRMIVSYTQLLERKFASSIDDEAREFMSFAREGAQRMQQIIYDLLLYNDLDSSNRQLQTINANLAVKNAVFKLDALIEEKGARITTDHLPEIYVDPKEFLVLMEHVLGNALKFTRPNVPPHIHISAAENENEWIFSVKDNGIGIQENHYSRIFNIFQRLHNRNEYNGSGIGLAICKKIVTLNGGNIWVNSTENNGSTFYFSLPKPVAKYNL